MIDILLEIQVVMSFTTLENKNIKAYQDSYFTTPHLLMCIRLPM